MKNNSTPTHIMRTAKGTITLATAFFFWVSLNAQRCGVNGLSFTQQVGFGNNSKIIIGGYGNNDGAINFNCYSDSSTYGLARGFNRNTSGIAPPVGSPIPSWSARIFQDAPAGALRIQSGAGNCYDTIKWKNGISVLATGGVGIGTDYTFGALLAVNGSVYTKGDVEINTTLAWPDYVFTPQYKRPTISEFRQQVFSLGYIPQIGSAERIAQGGLKVAEMQAKHLEVTELMLLYQFEMNERLDSLAQENTQLKSRLAQYATLDSLLNPAVTIGFPAIRPDATEEELKETIVYLLRILAKPEEK